MVNWSAKVILAFLSETMEVKTFLDLKSLSLYVSFPTFNLLPHPQASEYG